MRRETRIHQSTRTSTIDVPAGSVWSVVAGAGPGLHWYVDAAPLIFRDLLDRAVGLVTAPVLGPASPRATAPDRPLLEAGDRVGFWQVARASALRLDLVADVKSPGGVRLTTWVREVLSGTEIHQQVAFEPRGLLGQLYMFTDLPARETVIELVHRRLIADIGTSVRV